MTLYEECLIALGDDIQVMSINETEYLFTKMIKNFPMTSWRRVDWDRVDRKIKIDSIEDGINILKEKQLTDDDIYILWDEITLPAIKTKIRDVEKAIYDITAVSFDTWIFCPSNKYLIEFYHEDEITLAF